MRGHLISLIAALCTVAGASDREPPAPRSPGQIYKTFCAVCHGDKGDGNTHARQGLHPPPRDFTTRRAAAELSRQRMIEAVTKGRPGTAMVAWTGRLTGPEIEAVVDHIRDTFMADAAGGGLWRGAEIYARNCSVCHGEQGAGALWGRASLQPPPRDFTAARTQGGLDRGRMIDAVTHGRPGTAMAAFGAQLTRRDIEAVVDYIRERFMHAGPDRSAADPGLRGAGRPMPYGLVGDAARGGAFYHHNCATCHGEQGDGNGPRAYFIQPRPRNLVAERWRFDRPTLFQAIKMGRRGREMPAWGKVLSDQQIADVAEYVYQTFIRPQGSPAQE